MDFRAIKASEDSLQHYGVMGMKWGVRNEDTLRKYGMLKRSTYGTGDPKNVAKVDKETKIILGGGASRKKDIDEETIDRLVESGKISEKEGERLKSLLGETGKQWLEEGVLDEKTLKEVVRSETVRAVESAAHFKDYKQKQAIGDPEAANLDFETGNSWRSQQEAKAAQEEYERTINPYTGQPYNEQTQKKRDADWEEERILREREERKKKGPAYTEHSGLGYGTKELMHAYMAREAIKDDLKSGFLMQS